MDPTAIYYAYYSKTQEETREEMRENLNKKMSLDNIYLVEKDGVQKEALVTEVTCNYKKELENENFQDFVYVGKVIKWIKTVY